MVEMMSAVHKAMNVIRFPIALSPMSENGAFGLVVKKPPVVANLTRIGKTSSVFRTADTR